MIESAYDECSREPIHLLGAIQPYGMLLICRMDSWIVTHASENASALWSIPANDILSRDIRTLVSKAAFHTLANAASVLVRERECHQALGVQLFENDEKQYDVSVHRIGNAFYIEIEAREDRFRPQDNFSLVKSLVSALIGSGSDDEYFSLIAKQIRMLTTFDRAMIYRFREDGSGEVIAESCRQGLPSYLGLRYPAADIPQQARRLFLENRVRAIGDVDGDIVPILPRQALLASNPDLGMTTTRSVAGVHLQYLRNMGVKASLSVSIVIQGKLWGLIACHHTAPKWIGQEVRSTLDMLALLFSLQIEVYQRTTIASALDGKRNLVQSTLASINPEASLHEELKKRIPALKEMIACDGIGFWIDNEWYAEKVVLTVDQISQLVVELDSRNFTDIFSTRSIVEMSPSFAEGAHSPAGMLVLPISHSPKDYMLFFRGESASQVRWAGNPDEPKTRDGITGRLTPRGSFQEWKQLERLHSEEWSEVDIAIARQFRVSVLEFILRYSAISQKQREAAIQRQNLVVAELNHRVKNMLALFQSLVGHEKDLRESTLKRYVGNLRGRILALAAAHDNIIDTQTSSRSLRVLLHSELQPYLGSGRQAGLAGEDVILTVESYCVVALVIHEMVTNAVKYGAFSAQHGRIDVTITSAADGTCIIDWAESGGPMLSPVSTEGLGTAIIKRLIPHELRGQADIVLHSAGLRARFVLPATAIASWNAAESTPTAPVLKSPGSAAEAISQVRAALVVDDNMLIAMGTESMLKDIGIVNVEIASNVSDSLRILDSTTIDIAVLDINLGKETSLSLADAMKDRGIPFIFLTGYGDLVASMERHADVPSVRKPTHPQALRIAINAVLKA
jgi:light-regulated signal transduction histidine kinase (bacteriophytochrome)